MGSKLGIHITTASQAEEMRDFCGRAQPVAVKYVNPDAHLAAWIAEHCPNTLQIGRKYWGGNQPWDDGGRIARGIMDMSAASIIKVWEGVNEPSRDNLAAVCRADAEAARILHDNGFQYVCGSWSVGVPEIDDWLRPEMLEALREADYIGVHEYSAPSLDDPRGIEWFLMRHRLWYPTLPPDCQKPLLITEGGIDGRAVHWDVGMGGWQEFADAEDYMRQLGWYDEELQADPYVVAVMLFQWGSRDPRWDSYDHTPRFTQLLGEHIIAHQDAPPPPPPPPPPDPEPEPEPEPNPVPVPVVVGGIDISHHQGEIDWLTVSKSKTVERVIIRASYSMLADRRYHDNWLEAGAMGILRGSYHFLTPDDPARQAWLFLQLVEHCELGYWLDVEIEEGAPRVTESDVIEFLLAWEMLNDGHHPIGVYTSWAVWQELMGHEAQWAKGHDLWIANWNVAVPRLPEPWEDWRIWQYSSQGRIPGIDGAVDLNWFKL